LFRPEQCCDRTTTDLSFAAKSPDFAKVTAFKPATKSQLSLFNNTLSGNGCGIPRRVGAPRRFAAADAFG
jgi:hypothetical protein